ncbi:fibroblast growth factor [Sarotherodon galilaeus]
MRRRFPQISSVVRCTLRGPIYPTIHSAAVGVDNFAAKYGRRERPKSELSKMPRCCAALLLCCLAGAIKGSAAAIHSSIRTSSIWTEVLTHTPALSAIHSLYFAGQLTRLFFWFFLHSQRLSKDILVIVK